MAGKTDSREARGMSVLDSKDKRSYVAAGIFVFLVLLLIAYLTFIEVPDSNKDLITAIISMMVGGLGVSLNKLFGSEAEEIHTLRADLDEVKAENRLLEAKYQEVKQELDRFRESVLDRAELRHAPDDDD